MVPVRARKTKKDNFGEELAESYDNDGPIFSPEIVAPMVDFLAALAGEGAVAEFGVGWHFRSRSEALIGCRIVAKRAGAHLDTCVHLAR